MPGSWAWAARARKAAVKPAISARMRSPRARQENASLASSLRLTSGALPRLQGTLAEGGDIGHVLEIDTGLGQHVEQGLGQHVRRREIEGARVPAGLVDHRHGPAVVDRIIAGAVELDLLILHADGSGSGLDLVGRAGEAEQALVEGGRVLFQD